MDTNKLGVVELLLKYEMECCDNVVVACLDESVMACFYKNNKDDFDVDFIHAQPLSYNIEEILGGKCLVQHGFTQKIGW